MIRKIMHDMKKPYIVLLALFLCIVIAGSVFAAYTSINTAKRVLSTMPDSDMLFSSNYLREPNVDNTSYINRSIQFVDSQQDPTIFVSVCNYAQGVKAKWCDKDINYSFKVTLVDENDVPISSEKNYNIPGNENSVSGSTILGDNAYSVKKNDEAENVLSGGKFEFSTATLSSAEAQKNVYAIKIKKEYMPIVKIKVEAIASSTSPAYKNEKLAAYLVTSVYSNVVQAGWTGKFVDSDSSNSPSDFSGFNYDIEGSGEGIIALTWDESKVTISQRFLKDINELLTAPYKTEGPKDEGENGKKKIEFNVGGADCPDNFRVQFYRMAAPAENETWDAVALYVSMSYKKKAEGGEHE